jgi:hypothetical protein
MYIPVWKFNFFQGVELTVDREVVVVVVVVVVRGHFG